MLCVVGGSLSCEWSEGLRAGLAQGFWCCAGGAGIGARFKNPVVFVGDERKHPEESRKAVEGPVRGGPLGGNTRTPQCALSGPGASGRVPQLGRRRRHCSASGAGHARYPTR